MTDWDKAYMNRSTQAKDEDSFPDYLWDWLGRAIGLTFVFALMGWLLGAFL